MADSIFTPQGPSEISATVKAYTALKLAGLAYDDPNLTPRARADSGAGRTAARQQLRQGQSQPVRPVSARAYSHRFRPKFMLLGQVHLRDVVVDAGHRDSAVDRARHESAASGAGRIHAEGTVRARRAVRISQRRRLLQLAQFLPQSRQVPEILGARMVARPAHQGDPPRRAVDARAHALHRRRRGASIRP